VLQMSAKCLSSFGADAAVVFTRNALELTA
jgi:hypothetical protein